MSEIGIWKVSDESPRRFVRGEVNLEKRLEDWIERDPSLLLSNLSIVGRQVRLASGRLDLLGLDPFGRWAIIEIKRGNIRRETVIQAIDYAAALDELPAYELKAIVTDYLKAHGQTLEIFLQETGLDEMVFSPEERLLNVYVVGTGRDADLDRLLSNLSYKGGAMYAINFDVFQNEAGEMLLLRTTTETDISPNSEVDRLLALAAENGIGEPFRIVYEAALKCGLFARTFKWSIMFTSPTNKSRVLFVTWVKPRRNALDIYVVPQAFAEFYPISEPEVVEQIGEDGRKRFDKAQAQAFSQSLLKLFEKIKTNS